MNSGKDSGVCDQCRSRTGMVETGTQRTLAEAGVLGPTAFHRCCRGILRMARKRANLLCVQP